MASNRTAVLSAVIASVVTAGAFLLNPSADAHRARIEAVTAERSPLAGAIGIGVLKAFASEYHSLGIASYTTMADQMLSVGAFGMVFVLQSSSRSGK
jgi:hypothetical protein